MNIQISLMTIGVTRVHLNLNVSTVCLYTEKIL